MEPGVLVKLGKQVDQFCGSSLWNGTTTWNSSFTDFPECFKHTVLIWVPCGFFWLALPFYLTYLCCGRSQSGRCSAMNVTKIVLCLFAAVSSSAEVCVYYAWNIQTPVAHVASSIVSTVTMLVSAVLTLTYKRRGHMTSGVLWCYWLLWIFASFLMAYSMIEDALLTFRIDDEKLLPFVSTTSLLVLALLQFILACCSDAARTEAATSEGASPEHISSFTSFVTFHWLGPLVILARRQHLQESDLVALPPRDRLANHVPQFLEALQKLADARTKRRQLQQPGGVTTEAHLDDFNESTPLLSSAKGRDGASRGSTRKQRASKGGGRSRKMPDSKEHLPLGGVIWQCYKKLVLAAFLWKFLHDLLKFADPLLQRLLIQFIASEGQGVWKGYIIASGFVITQLLQTTFSQQVWHLSAMVGIQVRAALTAAVQKKALTITNDAKNDFPPQEVFNLVNVDIPRIQEAVKYLWLVWSAPLLVGLAMWQLYETVGIGAFAGLAFAAVTTPLIGQVASMQRRLQAKRALLRTERHRLTREAIGGIKVLKLHAWEPSFEERIELVRKEEMGILRKVWCVRAVQMGLWALTSLAVTIVMFTVKAVWSPEYVLLPEEAFVALSLLNIIKAPLNLLPIIVPYFCMAWTSMTRLTLFFEEPDVEGDRVQHELLASAVSIQGGTFTWLSGTPPTLNSINLDISESSLAAIVGKPSYGKSSLLAACIGDMYKVSGSINVNGSVAYVGQTPWIQYGTIRDNILFGKDYNEQFYKHVVQACHLESELLLFENNDLALVGETGVGLTASQKQLISLARAVYADADIYLIDNIFTSIGPDVSQRIYDNVIGKKGLLKDKTRIVVVQGVHWLPTVDSIVVMNCGGISEIGSYSKLASKDGPFTQYLKTYFLSDENNTTNNETMEMQAEILKHLVNVLGQREMQGIRRDVTSGSHHLAPLSHDMETSVKSYSSDIVAKGATAESDSACQSWRWASQVTTLEQDDNSSRSCVETVTACRLYFRAVGQALCVVCLLLMLFHFAATALADVWLGLWTADRLLPNDTAPLDEKSRRLNLYIYVYGCLGAAQAAFVVAFCCLLAIGLTKASRNLHKGLLQSIMAATMTYIDTTPFAAVFMRFSKDIDTLDDTLGFITFQTVQTLLFMLTTVAVITYSVPVFPPLLVPVGILAYVIQIFFEPLAKQVRLLEARAKLSLDVHFSELVSGTSVIRAYSYQDKYNELLTERVEKHSVTHYVSWVASRWLALRLEVASAFVVAGTAVLAVLSLQYNLPISASLAGMAITYALNAATSLQFIVRNNADMKDHVVCVKKIQECTEIPKETRGAAPFPPPRSLPGRADSVKETAFVSGGNGNMPANWPHNGVIEFRHYSARHLSKEPQMDFTGVTMFIKSAEKVGVINRSGSAAITLVLPVFRLIEPLEGAIVIDGIDITKVDRWQLRRRLTIIAQDPIMFSGTLRYNLDPCNEYSDDLIWNALERARLKKLVASLPGRLQYHCSEGGQNLSVSQRRLLGIARALMRKTKVVFVLDDPPAGDQATDTIVKKIIQREFSDCTVVTVTQRLHSIMTCDRILIMDGGCIAEFDAPSVLQRNTSGAFYEMAYGRM